MGIKDLKKILEQVHEPDEYQLTADNLSDPNYYIWKLENAKMKDLKSFLRPFRKEHERFDIFINFFNIVNVSLFNVHKLWEQFIWKNKNFFI